MPHINLPKDVPGILSLFAFDVETAKPLKELAEIVLRRQGSLNPVEREFIAAKVSQTNKCVFCASSHWAVAQALGIDESKITNRIRALTKIATKLAKDVQGVGREEIENAKKEGASDQDIHDTILIASAFCMYNRYVDGLNTLTPVEPAAYAEMGKHLAENGYVK